MDYWGDSWGHLGLLGTPGCFWLATKRLLWIPGDYWVLLGTTVDCWVLLWTTVDNWGDSEWDNKGSIYIPTACESKKCHVHFAFHPCEGSGTLHEYDGYRELAATNEIILVYPNSYCWNGDGSVPQESGKWLTRDGLYPAAIKAMICRVTTTASEESTCPMQASDLAFTGLALLASLAFLQ